MIPYIDFLASVYLTDLKERSAVIEAIEAKAADAATKALYLAGVTFDQAMAAEAARCNDEEFNVKHACAYDTALYAAQDAVAHDLKGTFAFITFGQR